MKLFSLLFRSSRSLALLAVVLSILDAIVTIGIIELIQQVLTNAASTGKSYGLMFVLFCIMILMTKVLSQIVITKVGEQSISVTLMSLCRQIASIPLRDLERIGSHRALAAVTSDVGVVAMSLQGIPVLIGNVLTLMVGLIYLSWISVRVAIYIVVFIAVGYFSYKWTASYGAAYLQQAREHQDELTKYLTQLIEGAKELKIHGKRMHSFLVNAVEVTNKQVRSKQFLGYSIQGTAITWGRLMFFVAIGGLLFTPSNFLMLEQGSRTACILVMLFLMTPVERIIAWIPLLSRASISIRKMESFGELKLEKEFAQPVEGFDTFQTIQIKDLTFKYDSANEERTFEFGPIDFEMHRGEVVFLVGGNGSGKTTFLKLFTGLYAPHWGEIQLDGIPIREDNRERYRQLFSVVFAEPMLFDVLHGLDVNGHERIAELLQHLELGHKVTLTDNQLSTLDLSKGQRKRLSLLTAYLEDRPVYVFDEWAADQDPIYKRVFYEEILPSLQKRNKAVLVISHDDQYFHRADRLVHLADGRISPQTHELAIQSK